MTARLGRFVPLLLVFAVGCFKSTDNVGSDVVDESAIHQSLHLTHHADRNSTQVFARFRVGGSGGTNLILAPPSTVTADGQPMTEQNGAILSDTLPGRSYARTIAGFQPQAEVKFTTRTGQVHVNTLKLEKVDFAADQPAQWSRARGITVTFVGPPLTAGETVLLSFTSDTAPTDRQQVNATAHSTKVGATSVTLTSKDLAPLPGGNGTAILTRTRTTPLQQGTKTGGELVSSYFSKSLAVKLVD